MTTAPLKFNIIVIVKQKFLRLKKILKQYKKFLKTYIPDNPYETMRLLISERVWIFHTNYVNE